MDKKEKALFRKVLEISSMVIGEVDERNIDDINRLFERIEIDLGDIIKKSSIRPLPIWRSFADMTEEEIRKEFSNVEKYPDLESIKSAVKGFLEMKKVSKVKTRETLIEHIIATYQKRQHIGLLGR